MGVRKICQHAGRPRPRGRWGTGPKTRLPLQHPAQPRALPAAHGSHCHDTGGRGAAPCPSTDWGRPRSACFARERRGQRLLRWAGQRGRPAAGPAPAPAPEGCGPDSTPVPSPGYARSAPAQAHTARASGGAPSRKRRSQPPVPKSAPAAPPAPRAAPHVPCRTTRPHAHACPRTYTPACGAPRAAQTPFASPGCPRLGRHGATALQRLDFIYGPRGEVLPLLRAPTSLPGPGAAAVPPGRSEHRARAAIKALSSPSLSACLCGRGSVPTAWGQPGGGLGSGLNSGRGAAQARGWPRAHTAPSLTHAPPVPAQPRTRTAPPSTRTRGRSSSATAPPRGRRARRRGAGRRRR